MRLFGLSALRGIGLDPYREPTSVYPGHQYVTVTWLQRALVAGGADIVADGMWGMATKAALDSFIERQGLPGTLYRRDTRRAHVVAVLPALEQALANASPTILTTATAQTQALLAPPTPVEGATSTGLTVPKMIGIGLVAAAIVALGAVVIAGER